MKSLTQNGKTYRVPDLLSGFQLDLYVHLINWKWKYITKEPGYFRGQPYDAILPEEFKDKLLPIHSSIQQRVRSHKERYPFKLHKFIGHMASSQAACANLFIPLLIHPREAALVLQAVKPDLYEIAVEKFDSGFRLEFWDEPDNALNDHNPVSGTDADIAIAYYTREGKLNLWLIEHKLTEAEFTTCGGYRSHGRNKEIHRCDSITEILNNPRLCYYDSVSNYRYWQITQANPETFPVKNLQNYIECPFKDGINQLWRNQLLAVAIETSKSERWPYERVYFSVVHHPKNQALDSTIASFRDLVGDSDRFSSFTSDLIINRAKALDFPSLRSWVDWYSDLYFI
jgi:hypothetical protein